MHRFFTLLLPAFLFAFTLQGQQTSVTGKKQFQVTAVAFYNFENLFDTLDDAHKFDQDFLPDGPYHYGSKIYTQKLHNLATVLQRLGTDVTPDGPAIIGTAEIENDNVLRDLCVQPEIKSRGYRFVHFEGPDSRGIDVALLYHPKYFRVINAQAHPVDISASGEKGGRTRDVLHVCGVLAGDTVHVFVNHWPSRRGGEAASAPLRALAAGVGRRVIDSLMNVNPDTRVIFMGDLNDDPGDASVAKVLGALGNKEKLPRSGLYNPFASYDKLGLGTLGYNDAWNLFDQIMISQAWMPGGVNKTWQYYKVEVFSRDFLKAKFGQYKGYPHRSFEGTTWIDGYSDHFPSLVYFIKPL